MAINVYNEEKSNVRRLVLVDMLADKATQMPFGCINKNSEKKQVE